MSKLELYDCTLREGEQASGVSFGLNDRIEILKTLNSFGVDYVELGWPVSKEVMEAFRLAKKFKLKTKIVSFGSTSISNNVEEDANLLSILRSRTKYACIFGKSSLEHVEKQLKISAEENLKKIYDSVNFLTSKGIKVFYDAEHYFDGFKEDKKYALSCLVAAAKADASCLILCDTNGGSMPEEIENILKETSEYLKKKKINVPLGIHCHNDSGLALANTLAALKYVKQIQATVNGLGERVGNTDMCELIPILVLKKNMKLSVKLEILKKLSEIVYKAANLPPQIRQPFVSSRAFMHKGGVHIDATLKGASYTHVKPEIFGAEHELILSSLGGSACVVSAAKKFGYFLDKNDKKTRKKIKMLLLELKEIEKKGYDIGNLEAEQYFLIEKYFGKLKEFFSIEKWNIKTEKNESECYIKGKVDGEKVKIKRKIKGGPVDAAYKTIFELISKKYDISNLKLVDYKVRIAKSRGAESSVRTRIEFLYGHGKKFATVGVDENIIQSSLEAIEKGFKYYLNTKY